MYSCFIKNARCATRIHNKVLKRSLIVKFLLERAFDCQSAVRKNEHKRNVEQCKSGSNIAKHAWTQEHKINFNTCKILDKATYRHRATQ